MPAIEIRDMIKADQAFVGTCTHVHDTPEILLRDEIDISARNRVAWLERMHAQGARVKVASLHSKPVGFLHLVPIEISPWGPMGQDLMTIPCLVVEDRARRGGAGRALMSEAEREAQRQGRRGIVITAFYHNFWFMPASFFERLGYTVADRRDEEALLWKAFDPSAEAPRLLKPDLQFEPVPGKVVIDLFWNTFCQTSAIEARRVREVAAEFEACVVLREHSADDRATLLRYQIPRGIFVNGRETGWGYEAPKAGIRAAIEEALGPNCT